MPMRILIVTDAWEPQINGVVRTYQNITRELRAMGHDVIVIGPQDFISVPMPGYGEIRLSFLPARKLGRLMRAARADAVHIAVEGPLGWAARRWCLRNRVPFSTTYHTHFPDYMAVRTAWLGRRAARAVRDFAIAGLRRFHAPARCMFVATQSLEDQLRAWGFTTPKIRLVRGVDTGVFHPGPSPHAFAGPVMLYVGRVSDEKNIEAFLALPNPGTKIVVGDGPSRAALEKKYPHAVFAGVQTGTALGDYYRCADVFVFPSRTDTFGMVLIEALACGVPIAGYDVTGPRDIVDAPFLGAVGDDLGTAVAQALAAPGTRAERAAHAAAAYSWRAVAQVFAQGKNAA